MTIKQVGDVRIRPVPSVTIKQVTVAPRPRPWLVRCVSGREFVMYAVDAAEAQDRFEDVVLACQRTRAYGPKDVRDLSNEVVASTRLYTRDAVVSYVDNRKAPGV